MGITDLDELLKYFYNNRQHDIRGLLFDEIEKDFTKAHYCSWKEMLMLLQKLESDGYVTRKPLERIESNAVTGEIKKQDTIPGFYISFDGILFFENVPADFINRPYQYAQKKQHLKDKAFKFESWPKRNWHWLAIITFLIGGFADLGKEALHRKIFPESVQSNRSTATGADSTLKINTKPIR